MTASGNEQGLEIVLEATSTRYDENDDRWLSQVADLHETLVTAEAGEIRKEITPVPGKKGGIEQVILALGSAGAFTAAVTVFKLWLNRDRGRKLTLRVKVGNKEEQYEVTGDAKEETLREFMHIAVARRGGK